MYWKILGVLIYSQFSLTDDAAMDTMSPLEILFHCYVTNTLFIACIVLFHCVCCAVHTLVENSMVTVVGFALFGAIEGLSCVLEFYDCIAVIFH